MTIAEEFSSFISRTSEINVELDLLLNEADPGNHQSVVDDRLVIVFTDGSIWWSEKG